MPTLEIAFPVAGAPTFGPVEYPAWMGGEEDVMPSGATIVTPGGDALTTPGGDTVVTP